MPAHGREAAREHRLLPGSEIPERLRVAAGQLADRARAEAEQQRPGLGGVAHEVPAQGPVRKRLGKLVFRLREVVEADVAVARLQQAAHAPTGRSAACGRARAGRAFRSRAAAWRASSRARRNRARAGRGRARARARASPRRWPRSGREARRSGRSSRSRSAAARDHSTSLPVCSTDCSRWIACCTRGSKSCTPIEMRLKPHSASAATCSCDVTRGSTSIETSAPARIGKACATLR